MSDSSFLCKRIARVKIFPNHDEDAPLVKSVPPHGARGADATSPSTETAPPSSSRSTTKTSNDECVGESPFSFIQSTVAALLPKWNITDSYGGGLFVKTLLGTTLALYVLNQKHMLPKPLSAIVSKALFWPSLPITLVRRIGTWTTMVDETVVMGGAPLSILGIPERLADEYGVMGVVNMCQEYAGPATSYKQMGIQELWLPTVDHFEPSVRDLKSAVSFIESHKAKGERVYVHCRAGHGRSAAVVLCHLLYQDPSADPRQLNAELCQLRNVRKSLWCQPNVRRFHSWVKSGGKLDKTKEETSQALLDDTDHCDEE